MEDKIKVIIFDVGDVILRVQFDDFFNDLSVKTGKKQNEIKKIFFNSIDSYERGLTTEKEFLNRVAKFLKYNDKITSKFVEKHQSHVKPKPGAIKIIKQLKNKYRIAAITNTIWPHYLYNRRMGYYDLFEKVIASCNIKMRKPDPKIYTLTARKLKVEPWECIFIDNMRENVIGARKVGMKAIHYKDHIQLKKDLKKYGVTVK